MKTALAVLGMLTLLYWGANLGMWIGAKLNHRLKFRRWLCDPVTCRQRYWHG
jgi:hypothetical protein